MGDEGFTLGYKAGVLVAVAPMRLAAAAEPPLPQSVRGDDHKLVVEQALAWQQTAGHAEFWEMGAASRGADEGRVYAIAGQIASAGEQLALAHAAAVEVAIWQEHRQLSEPDPASEVCMRGMAEAQCLFVMGTGHALANVAVKALALSPLMRTELVKKFRRGNSSPTFAPFSGNRADWVTLNAGTCKAIQEVAHSCGTEEVIRLIEPVTSFGTGPGWRDLGGRRGEDFHRWRPQTHGIAGVPQSSPWRSDGRTRTLGIGHSKYEEARGLADDAARLASEAMIELAQSMETFMQRWPLASRDLGGPEFALDE